MDLLKIGSRESPLAQWQAKIVQQNIEKLGIKTELVWIKSEGDIDLITPLYAMGVQGVFTRTLDSALLEKKIDIAVHSMKDVPIQLAQGIAQIAVLQRKAYQDILITKNPAGVLATHTDPFIIGTSSIRRKAQWLNRYPNSIFENLRGNMKTRLEKLKNSNWTGAIYSMAGLGNLNLLPKDFTTLDWMLPAPAQGAIVVTARENDSALQQILYEALNDPDTERCTKIERDFLQHLMGGCATPIAGLAKIENEKIIFRGNLLSVDGKQKIEVEKIADKNSTENIGKIAADEIIENGGRAIIEKFNTAYAG